MGFFDYGSGVAAGLIAGKPNLPKFVSVDPQDEQRKAIEGNLAAMPAAQQLASSVNQFNAQQLDKMLEGAIPGFSGIKQKASATITDLMAGKVPTDVQDQISQSAAARALGGGFAGGSAHGNLVARDLGLTSLGLVDKGLSSAESWTRTMASIQQPGMFNLASMFVSPTTQLANAASERNAKFQHDWNKELIDWQSSFGYLLGNEINQNSAQFNSMVGSVAGSAAGSAAGGGGGGGC